MMIRVEDIQSEGLTITSAAAVGAPFSDASWRLEHVGLRLDRDERDVLVRGEIGATVPLVCGRCLEVFPRPVRVGVDVRVVPRPTAAADAELAEDDLNVDFYDNDELDLARLIETETTLALPMKPLCRDDCLGLCPLCGGNRNLVACACRERRPAGRLAVLKDLAARSSR